MKNLFRLFIFIRSLIEKKCTKKSPARNREIVCCLDITKYQEKSSRVGSGTLRYVTRGDVNLTIMIIYRHTPTMYPTISPANAGFRSPYPTSLPITSSGLSRSVKTPLFSGGGGALPLPRDSDHCALPPTCFDFFFFFFFSSDLYRFSPTGLIPPHPGLSPHAHALASHALVSSAPKTDHSTLDHNHRFVRFIPFATFVSLATSERPPAKPPRVTPVRCYPDVLAGFPPPADIFPFFFLVSFFAFREESTR